VQFGPAFSREMMNNQRKERPVIAYDAPDLVKRVTVTGFVDASGRFWGDDENMARYASCTHVRCACGSLVEKGWTACDGCREKKDIERYQALKKEEWDGVTMLYSGSHDRYFQDIDEVIDLLRDLKFDGHETDVEDLRLVICTPNKPRLIDIDHFTDDLPEDEDNVPNPIWDAINAFNEVMRAQPPLSWSPGKVAAIVKIAPEDIV
jgi:hypothetical protein